LLEGCPIVGTRTRTTAERASAGKARTGVPQRLLVASGPFDASLPAERVAAAIARGVLRAGAPEPDVCPIEAVGAAGGELRELLDELDFDARMRDARALVVAVAALHERTLAGSVAFELATRARQGGVPAYAVTAENTLDAFDARILDLQLILRAGSARALTAAGVRLAQLA
jgi:glycerate kinase